MSRNSGVSPPTPYLEQVVKYFKQQYLGEKSYHPSPASKALAQQFQKIYAGKLSENLRIKHVQIQKYQADWEKLLLQKETSLSPVPEAYVVKLINSAFRDEELQYCLDKYTKPYIGSIYIKRVTVESCKQVVDEGALDSEPNTHGKSTDAVTDEIVEALYAQRFQDEDGPENDVTFLMCVNEIKKPNNIEQLHNILRHLATMAFDHRNLKMFIGCKTLSNAALFVSWTNEQKMAFDVYYNSPMNKRIIENWRKESANTGAQPKSLSFPTALPNNITEDVMETFIGYYQSDRFTSNVYMLSALKYSYKDGTTVVQALEDIQAKSRFMK
ncbi:hypothetical protein JCM33374_g1575 [Metschnikowia sp. JCM 33374]|nr:hypothetical protein JCM33374_g1575 [Metschnikowia sp. JCM 33374]